VESIAVLPAAEKQVKRLKLPQRNNPLQALELNPLPEVVRFLGTRCYL
jgi:hypothetical protein